MIFPALRHRLLLSAMFGLLHLGLLACSESGGLREPQYRLSRKSLGVANRHKNEMRRDCASTEDFSFRRL